MRQLVPDLEIDGTKIPAYAHLQVPFTRIGPGGHWSTKFLLSVGLLTLSVALVALTYFAGQQIDSIVVQVVVYFGYGLMLAFTVYKVQQNFANQDALWEIASSYSKSP